MKVFNTQKLLMFTFKKRYFLFTLMLFLIEILIALYVKDSFVRPYLGDVLVVILIYCFIRTFFKFSVLGVALFTLIFSFFIEFLQFFQLINKLNLQDSELARTVLGTSFSFSDLLAYTVGILVIIITEYVFSKYSISS